MQPTSADAVAADGGAPGRSEGPSLIWPALLLSIVLSFEYVAFGAKSWLYDYGAGLEVIPVYLGLARTGSLFSLWVPFLAGGQDRLSFWGSADPFNVEPILFALLAPWLANGLHVFAQRFIAIYFTARVCQEQLHLGWRVSLLAGVAHGALSYYTVGFLLAYPAVPLALWLLGRLPRYRRWWMVAPAVGVLFSTLTSISQSVPYILVFVAAWFAVVVRERRLVFWSAAALFSLALIVAELPSVLALVANAATSQRSAWRTGSFTENPMALLSLELEFDAFSYSSVTTWLTRQVPIALGLGGAIVAAVLVVTGRRCSSTRPMAITMLSITLVYLVMAMRRLVEAAQDLLLPWLPWIAGINPVRFYTVPGSFLVSVMVTVSLMVILPTLDRMTVRQRLLVGSLFAILCFGFWYVGADGSAWSIGLLLSMLVMAMLKRSRTYASYVYGAIVVVMILWVKIALIYPLMIDEWTYENYDLASLQEIRDQDRTLYRVSSVLPLQPTYAYAVGFETADGWANLYPSAYRDLWLRVLEPLFDTLPDQRSIFDSTGTRVADHHLILGTGATLPGEPEQRILSTGFDLAPRFNLRLLSLLNVKYLFSEYPLNATELRLVHTPIDPPERVAIRSLATGRLLHPHPDRATWSWTAWASALPSDVGQALARRQQGKDLYVYENVCVLPRAWLADRVKVVDNSETMLSELSRLSVADLSRIAMMLPPDLERLGLDRPDELAQGALGLTSYGTDQMSYQVQLADDRDGLMVVSMTWSRFWTARVDGQPRAVARVDHTLVGVPLRPGDRSVVLSYEPPYQWIRPVMRPFSYLLANASFYQKDRDLVARDRLIGELPTDVACKQPSPVRETMTLAASSPDVPLDTLGRTNLSLGQPARQSTVDGGGTADRAVDGVTDGDYAHQSTAQTEVEANVWWEVDLQAVRQIGDVEVWPRTDCCPDLLNEFSIVVSEAPFVSDSAAAVNWQAGATSIAVSRPETSIGPAQIPVNRAGRYVRVQAANQGRLALAEVRVWEARASDPTASVAGGGVDLALGRPSRQSTTAGQPADLAVDGDPSGNSFSHTEFEAQPWLEVDLGSSQAIGTIEIWNRRDCCPERLQDFYVLVADAPIDAATLTAASGRPEVANYWVPGPAGYPTSIPIGREGRFVRVQLPGSGYLSIAELRVQAPPDP